MKVIIDTNVLVSGVFWKGPPHQILSEWRRGQFEIVISPDILTEYERVLDRVSPKGRTELISDILRMIHLNSTIVVPDKFPSQVCTDKDDDKFLEAAISSKSEVIVTGDKVLLHFDGLRGIQILRPADFLSLLGKKKR